MGGVFSKNVLNALLIFPLRTVAPLSAIYVAYRLYRRWRASSRLASPPSPLFSHLLLALRWWAFAEVAFWIYAAFRSWRLQRPVRPPPCPDPVALMQKCFDSLEFVHSGGQIADVPTDASESRCVESLVRSWSRTQLTDTLEENRTATALTVVSSSETDTGSSSSRSRTIVSAKNQSTMMALKCAEARGWFFGAELESIRRGNVREWMAACFFHAEVGALTHVQVAHVNRLLDLVEQWMAAPFADGYNPEVKCMRLSMDPIPAVHRPLIYYAVTSGVLVLLARSVLSYLGFESHRSGTLHYWYRPRQPLDAGAAAASTSVSTSTSSSASASASSDPGSGSGAGDTSTVDMPLVFCHGLGIGNLAYLHFIARLLHVRRPTQATFLLELPHISNAISEDVPSDRQLAACISGMLATWSFTAAHFVGHSFGSIVVAWMVLLQPACVSYATFIDPVCFLLAKYDVAYNSIYREPETATQMLMSYFVTKELYIAHSLCRRFFWFQNIIWPDEIHVPYLVVLSGRDSVVPAHSIHRYLVAVSRLPTSRHLRLLWYPELGHGECIFTPTDAFNEICHSIVALESQPPLQPQPQPQSQSQQS